MRRALLYSKKLEEAGLSRQQAETHLEILEEIVEDEMATKADIQSLKSEATRAVESLKLDTTRAIESLRLDTTRAIEGLKSEIKQFRSEMMQMEYKITIKLGLMLAAAVGILATLQKFS